MIMFLCSCHLFFRTLLPHPLLGDLRTRLMGVSTEFVRRFVRLSQSLLIPSITFLNFAAAGAKTSEQQPATNFSSGRKRVRSSDSHCLMFNLIFFLSLVMMISDFRRTPTDGSATISPVCQADCAEPLSAAQRIYNAMYVRMIYIYRYKAAYSCFLRRPYARPFFGTPCGKRVGVP